ncbi:MAG: cell division protein FtsK [Streptosporangiales bacterium]|nr:cell division protein FtsK [Streptosporangiales bacterium]
MPALVPLLDHGHLAIRGGSAEQTDALVAGLLLRLVASYQPGSIKISLYDPRRLGSGLGGLLALARPGLLTTYAPHDIESLLQSLTGEIRRIQEEVLGGRHASLAALAAAAGRRTEPWRVVVVQAPARGLPEDALARLHGVMHAGPACGIHVICCDLPLPESGRVETVRLHPDGLAESSFSAPVLVRPDPAPPADLVRAVCERIVAGAGAGRAPMRLADLIPEEPWQRSSGAGVTAPIGDDPEAPEPDLVEVALGDDPPHALIGGPSGSGKTNFLYTLLATLGARYSPDELEFYLLDFKEGVSFARLARGRRDPTWLPHARLIGVNVNDDREFGLALLRYLAAELRRRAEAAKEHEVTKLEELRAQDPDGRWPRIVAVIDEFQVLLGRRDAITEEAVGLLEDLARRGRSQGLHLVLSSQDVSGIEALWGRSSMLAQFTLRIALPKARRVLAEENRAAERIPRFCAVVNPDSGLAMANRVVRLPDASSGGTYDAVQRTLWERRPRHLPEPRLFDGGVVPALADSPDFRTLAPADGTRDALVGQVIDLEGSAARVAFSRSPGRNLAVIGTRTGEACDVLVAATLSLARQHEPGTATFTVVCLDDDAYATASTLTERLESAGHPVRLRLLQDLPEVLAKAAAEVDTALSAPTGPGVAGARAHYLTIFAVDAAGPSLAERDPATRTTGLDVLRKVVARGPETRTHMLGWWRTVGRLKDDLGGLGSRLDDVGAWLALDVQGQELSPLPGGQLLTWAPRSRRALFFDRTRHDRPRPVIPFRDATEAR